MRKLFKDVAVGLAKKAKMKAVEEVDNLKAKAVEVKDNAKFRLLNELRKVANKVENELAEKINAANVVDEAPKGEKGLVPADKVLIVQMNGHKVIRVVEMEPTPELLEEEIVIVPYRGEDRIAIIEEL